MIDAARVRAAHGDAWQVMGRMRERLGGGALELRGIRLMASGLPHPQWNNGDVTAPDCDVDGARAFYAERRVPWGVRVPTGMPWTLGTRLFTKRLMGLEAARTARPPAVAGLTIRAAGPEDAEAVVAVDAEAFEAPAESERRWIEPHLTAPEATVALAEIRGEPVATGYGVRSAGRAGPAVYIAGIGVVASARRRGIGAAVTSWLVEDGHRRGARLAHLHPDDDGAARLYARLGFVEVPGLDVYVDL